MSKIITFYSYKGGVGRTMALANVSVVLSKWGYKVLVVDWDLEAPGLEHFYKEYITDIKLVETKHGVIDLLQLERGNQWQDDIIEVNIPESNVPIHLISSGKRDEDYFKKVRSFDVDDFYAKDGGDIIEQLRGEWLANYDYVLIDSRTGITEIGGICTIQLPDTVVMLFTATNQGFEGVLDIIIRAGAAQQKLPYDRQKLIFLPIPSKFDSNLEFKLSQSWLERFAKELGNTYDDWLPASIDRKDFLELTKIPYIPYFSFGEKLPVIEQGIKDPSGLGYAYESLAVLIADNLNNVDLLYNNRDKYISTVNKYPSLEKEAKRNGNGNSTERRLRLLKQELNVNEEVKIEKSKNVIIECLTNNILPFLNEISKQLRRFDSLFKDRKEKIITDFEYINDNGETNVYASESKLEYLIDDVQNTISLDGNNLNSLIYSYNYWNLRNSNKYDISFIFKITIYFYQLVFEIICEGPDTSEFGKTTIEPVVRFDIAYHEDIPQEESELVIQALNTYLVEKIEIAAKK